MKCVGKIGVCFACVLALNAGLRAGDVASPGNPYAPVVERNIFALNPPTIPTPAAADPPVKITPNGIMSIFGHLQVLFKVAKPAQPGKPNGDQSYILMEGQRQDDIEVTKINENAGIVTFNNHGEIQEIPLTVALPINTPAPAAVAVNPTPGILNVNNNPRGFGSFGGRNSNVENGGNHSNNTSGNHSNNTSSNNSNNTGNGSNPGHASVQNPLADQITPGLTPEVQTISLEAARELTKQQIISGEMPSLPITELTPPDAVGVGGVPLMKSPDESSQ